MYHVQCEVSGGVTGHRTALLKSDNKIVEFDTFAAAQEEAARLQKEALDWRHSTASFRYWAV